MSSVKEIAALRKQLQKADLKTLQNGDLFSQSIDVVTKDQPNEHVLEALALHLGLYRQLRAVFDDSSARDSQTVTTLVHTRLGPAMQYGQPVSALLVKGMESSNRTQAGRAMDALSAAGRMVDSLPPASEASSGSAGHNLLVPLFRHLAQLKSFSRSELVIISILLPHIPTSAIPDDLLDTVLENYESVDSASTRSSIAGNLLLRQADVLLSGAQKGNEKAKDERILGPIVPLITDHHPPTTMLNLTRYLLPLIFNARPSTARTLLDIVDEECDLVEDLTPWISIASLAVSSGHLRISELPSIYLQSALSHAQAHIRILAFQLLAGSKNVLDEQNIDHIKMSFRYNAILPSSGSRSDFGSAVYAFFRRVSETQAMIARRSSTDPSLITARDLLDWLLTDFIDSGLRVACRHPVARAILALSVLKLYLDVFGKSDDVQRAVFTRDRVDSLLVCHASESTEVRVKARSILENARIPLPGYETPGSPATQQLLNSALASLNHPRKVQAEAGKSALCIVFQKLLSDPTYLERGVAFVTSLIDSLEARLVQAERDLVSGIEQHPLHGSIAALSDVIACVKLQTPDAQVAWKPVFHRLSSLVGRVWQVTRQVIALAPTKQQHNVERPDHEIARAYEVMGAGEEEEDDEAMDHTNLLSGCWRATKEAGELLSRVISLPLTQDKPGQSIWSTEDVDRAGHQFLKWMHEIRHRGTFSKMALAFGDLISAVKSVESLRPLCAIWLERELEIITTDTLSTTRRSAALPYAVLALVSSDQALLDHAFDRLNALAQVEAETSDITKVHAFNVLKIVLLDSRQARALDRYFERAVMTALHAFASPNWNVRNVGLILFSTIVHRSLSASRGTQDYFASRSTLASRQTLANWHNRYPSIMPYITEYLEKATKQPVTGNSAHSPLFPILIIIRSLRWSEEGAQLAELLYAAVEPFLSSREWQVREVSAQALSSLVSPHRALESLRSQDFEPIQSMNERHGKLLLVRHVIAEVIGWSDVAEDAKIELDVKIEGLGREANNTALPCLVRTEQVEILAAYIANADRSHLRGKPIVDVSAIITNDEIAPGASLLVQSAARHFWCLGDRHRSTSVLLSKDTHEDAKLHVLDEIINTEGNEDSHNPAVFQADVDLICDSSMSDAVRTEAVSALIDAPWNWETEDSAEADQEGVVSLLGDVQLGTWRRIENALRSILDTSKCMPLRTVASAGLAMSLAQVWKAEPDGAENLRAIQTLLVALGEASDPEQPESTRQMVVQAIHCFAKDLYPTNESKRTLPPALLVQFHQLILRLLQDDNEALRSSAASIVISGSQTNVHRCHSSVMAMQYTFLGQYAELTHAHEAYELLWTACIDEQGTAADFAELRRRDDASGVIFEVEPPNLFRDPLHDVSLAAQVLAELGPSASPETWAKGISTLAEQHSRVDQLRDASSTASPIDRSFDAVRRLRQRAQLQRHLLGAEGADQRI